MAGVSLIDPPGPAGQRPAFMERPLGDIRAHLVKKAREGCRCPACGQRVQLYRRKFNSGMAATLVCMWAETLQRERFRNMDPWIHVEHDLVEKEKAPKRCRDFSQMRFFGLIEPKARTTRSTGLQARDTGYWRVTNLGRVACENPRRPLVRKIVLMFDNAPQGFEGPEISVLQALSTKFEFNELMFGVAK